MRRWAGRPSPGPPLSPPAGSRGCSPGRKLPSPACPRGSAVGTGQGWPDGLNLTAWAEGPAPIPLGSAGGYQPCLQRLLVANLHGAWGALKLPRTRTECWGCSQQGCVLPTTSRAQWRPPARWADE